MEKQNLSTFLVLNPGSSSEKISVYKNGELTFTEEFEKLSRSEGPTPFEKFLEEFKDPLTAVLVRLVAPGHYFTRPRLVDEDTMEELEKARPFSPIHIPLAKADIKIAQKYFGDTPILLICDSEFLAKPSRRDYAYALPEDITEENDFARYGAHGLSYGYVVNKLKEENALEKKTIICHLGSGCSVSAFENGEPVYTSMGETPMEGLMSSTRPGAVDPIMIAYLGSKMGFEKASAMLSGNSGLKALSGSNDLVEVLKSAKSGNAGAAQALNIFIDAILGKIGEYTAKMGGVDEIVFTGTVGKRSAFVHGRVISKLAFLGFNLKREALPDAEELKDGEVEGYSNTSEVSKKINDLTKENGYTVISTEDSKPVLIVPTDEADYMARVAAKFFSADGSPLL